MIVALVLFECAIVAAISAWFMDWVLCSICILGAAAIIACRAWEHHRYIETKKRVESNINRRLNYK